MKYLLILIILVITSFLIWVLGFSSLSPFKHKILSPKTSKQEETLKIIKPEDGSVVSLSNLKIEGKAKPNSYLAVFTQNNSQILKISSSGDFKTELTLSEGYNLLKLVDFEINGTSIEKELSVFYLSEKFANSIKFDSGTKQATGSSKTEEFVQRLLQLRQKNNLKTTSGILKGILNNSLELETKAGSRTVIIDSESQTGVYPDFASKIDSAKIGAKDFIVAVGSFEQQGILTAKILLVNHGKAPDFAKLAKFGIITSINPPTGSPRSSSGGTGGKNSLEIVDIQTGEKITLNLDQNSQDETGQKTDVKNLVIGNKVLVVGTPAEKILVIDGNFLPELEKFATPSAATQSATQSAK